MGSAPSHWVQWHDDYDRPGSFLAERLRLVTAHVAAAIAARPAGPVRLISRCAGQGRDVAGAIEGHPRRADVVGRLVELDPANVASARERLAGSGLEVVEGDAGTAAAYAGFLPADVLLVCGVFGNVSEGDIRRTVAALPGMCLPGARVIWTRHRGSGDVTPAIRGWFAEAGFREVAFEAPEDMEIGVGVHELAEPLFTFV
jgi:hypothetical protein